MSALPSRTLVDTQLGYVHVRCVGDDGEGPAIVLLHQSPLSSRMWNRVMSQLAPLPVLAPDMLGHGGSDRPPGPVSLAEHAQLMLDSVNAIVPGPKILVGNHVGAAFAAQLAVLHPEETSGLVLIGYPLYHDWEDRYSRFVYLNPLEINHDGEALLELWRAVDSSFVDDVSDEVRLTELADRVQCGRIWYEAYVTMFTVDLRSLLADVARLGTRALVLAPEHDTLAAYADEVAATLRAPLVSVSGGTRVTWEHPRAVGDAIRDLVRG